MNENTKQPNSNCQPNCPPENDSQKAKDKHNEDTKHADQQKMKDDDKAKDKHNEDTKHADQQKMKDDDKAKDKHNEDTKHADQ
ncbi:hypothetical protein VU08_05805 [Desulfobulbus sp. F5]|nr:hypothetical protein [Desulfobulbus sp. F5]